MNTQNSACYGVLRISLFVERSDSIILSTVNSTLFINYKNLALNANYWGTINS